MHSGSVIEHHNNSMPSLVVCQWYGWLLEIELHTLCRPHCMDVAIAGSKQTEVVLAEDGCACRTVTTDYDSSQVHAFLDTSKLVSWVPQVRGCNMTHAPRIKICTLAASKAMLSRLGQSSCWASRGELRALASTSNMDPLAQNCISTTSSGAALLAPH